MIRTVVAVSPVDRTQSCGLSGKELQLSVWDGTVSLRVGSTARRPRSVRAEPCSFTHWSSGS